MDTAEKRRFIEENIEKYYSEDPVILTFSMPHFRTFRYMRKDSVQVPVSFPAAEEAAEKIPAAEEPPQQEDAKTEKQKKLNEKAMRKMTRDIEKRGFSPDIFSLLSDPADIYEMSDDELLQINASGLVNEDGFYSFRWPSDFENAKDISKVKRTAVFIASFCLVITVLLVVLINNVFSLF